MDRLSYFTGIREVQIKSYQIQCHEQSQQSGVHPHLFLNIVYVANSPKNILPDFFPCLVFKMRVHYKKYVIHMSLTHFYPVHQNAVFILNVKMPFMSLYMSPFKLLFLNDIGTCFASFKIYWGICNTVPNTGFWGSSFCLLWRNSCFLGSVLICSLNSLFHFSYLRRVTTTGRRKPTCNLQLLSKENLALLSSGSALSLHGSGRSLIWLSPLLKGRTKGGSSHTAEASVCPTPMCSVLSWNSSSIQLLPILLLHSVTNFVSTMRKVISFRIEIFVIN